MSDLAPPSKTHSENTLNRRSADSPEPVAVTGLSSQERQYQAELANRVSSYKAYSQKLAQYALDEKNWLTVAEHVLHGDYEQADTSTLKAIWFGLSAFQHTQCVEAAKRVREKW